MRYRHLGDSGLEVSAIGLGANSFGEPGRRDAAESAAIVHAAIDHGINFVDTSNVYAEGLSEEYIGRALRGRRHEMLIGTKFGSRRRHGPNLFGGSRKFVFDSVEASLKRLQTDYIDLYMIHRPDPRMPLEETLRAMDDLVRQGKVRYIGCCNFEAWRMVDGLWLSWQQDTARFVSSQFGYSMLNRSAEKEMVPACRKLGVGIIPYLPLAAGFLTGKVRRGAAPRAGTRLALDQYASAQWLTEEKFTLLERLSAFAAERGRSMVCLALAWLLANPAVGTIIAGASSPKHIAQNVEASQWRLSSDENAEVDAILDCAAADPGDTYFSVADYFKTQTEV